VPSTEALCLLKTFTKVPLRNLLLMQSWCILAQSVLRWLPMLQTILISLMLEVLRSPPPPLLLMLEPMLMNQVIKLLPLKSLLLGHPAHLIRIRLY
jgi:hypothetical protein